MDSQWDLMYDEMARAYMDRFDEFPIAVVVEDKSPPPQ